MPSPAEFALLAGALFVASAVNALVGFGFALTSVPLMALAVGPRDAVVLSALMGMLSSGGVALRHHEEVARPIGARLVAGSLVGMPIGLFVLVAVPEQWIGIGIGVVVLAAVVLLAGGWQVERIPAWADLVAGLVSGVLNTSVGVGGPPVVTALQGHGLDKARFRATTTAVFAAGGLVSLVLFALSGQIERSVVAVAVLALPAWPAGWWVGDRLHHRFPEERFRTLVLVMLAATAVLSLLSAVRG